jgi:hypothetical protein
LRIANAAQERKSKQEQEKQLKEQQIANAKILEEIRDKYRILLDIATTTYDLKVCPKCFELKMELLKFSPTGQSITCKCTHCSKGQILKLLTGKSESEIVDWLDNIKTLIGTFRGILDPEFWQKEIDNTFTVNINADSVKTAEAVKRNVIPEAVRHEVWRRDGGKCVNCGSQENLEFDHIIPISKGGANTSRNLQLFCEPCNRKKSSKI